MWEGWWIGFVYLISWFCSCSTLNRSYIEIHGPGPHNPTNTPRGFHVKTTWKRPFPRRFNVWNLRGVFVGKPTKLNHILPSTKKKINLCFVMKAALCSFRLWLPSETWHIQNLRHIHNLGIFRTLSNIYDGAFCENC